MSKLITVSIYDDKDRKTTERKYSLAEFLNWLKKLYDFSESNKNHIAENFIEGDVMYTVFSDKNNVEKKYRCKIED